MLVGDRRISRGGASVEYEDKIFSDVPNVVIGASGVVGLFDKFRRQIRDVAALKPSIGTADFIKEAEKIVYGLNTEYYERTRSGIALLVGYGRIMHGQLQYVTQTGLAEEVRRYQVIGSGTPYGAYLLRTLWKATLAMKQAAILGALVIKHIEDNELDDAVGVGKTNPQIWFVPDWPSGMTPEKYESLPANEKTALDTREISQSDLDEIQRSADEQYVKIGKSLADIAL
jgi:20S proteasome alpha/beta subunit